MARLSDDVYLLMPNTTLQRTVKKLRFLASAELER